MRTINVLLFNMGYTISSLKRKCKGICNGCGGKGGIDFNKIIKSLPYFNTNKGKQLFEDIKLLCNVHDIMYNKGGGVCSFMLANILLASNIYKLLYWTTLMKRLLLFILIFSGTTIFGIKYFNWKY